MVGWLECSPARRLEEVDVEFDEIVTNLSGRKGRFKQFAIQRLVVCLLAFYISRQILALFKTIMYILNLRTGQSKSTPQFHYKRYKKGPTYGEHSLLVFRPLCEKS